MVAFLKGFGYERAWPKDTTVRGIARIMAEAEAVIAPHGAGFSNIFFASPGTKVLELIGARYTLEYWTIANERKQKYYAFEADGPDGKNHDPEALMKLPYSACKNMYMRIPMEKFEDFLETNSSKNNNRCPTESPRFARMRRKRTCLCWIFGTRNNQF